ncbi:lipoate--protein ligase [Convivina intestini]|uniref:lipoate--protein ligase n=1 Tax=Convivina intestini TaxID=1505726 RepID=A0A2U1DBW6_9LACO|nr:lipoate--protein ligase [Convivina intestini]PVY85193.1 lipoate-protein ligase A [Convivina intestini]CAH1852360.1 Lipoate-protein ligase LplJ [Convivina intestini]CAH1854571.1 Lipoate-protein ligase LplJ [Convivina intestini]SDC00247.1 lipoate-protein ligase [Leuconostocaceae bacterium R-53105]
MQYINYFGTDAYTNIAMDTWLLENLDLSEPVFSLWRNKRAVIVGRNQNTFAEINQKYIDEHDVQVVRRVSGGGAVYHDLGNICFTFFVPVKSSAEVDFKKFVQPMCDALRSIGIETEISGRNDLTIDDKKVSGNAQRYVKGYLMHHGTLLWDTDVDAMVRALNVADEKFISKAAKSVRSRVGNIRNYAPENMSIEKFMDLLRYYLTDEGKDGEYKLTDEQKQSILDLRDQKFATWEWNYGHSPEFTYHNHEKFDGGSVDVYIDVHQGKIDDIEFRGDFLGVRDWRDIKDAFIGQAYTPATLKQILAENRDGQYFGSVTDDQLLSVIFDHKGKVKG